MRKLWLRNFWVFFVALNLACKARHRENTEHPSQIDPQALNLLQISHQNYQDNIRDYQCIFLKRERFGGYLGKFEEIQMKLRTQPYSIYMKWLSGRYKGQEALYVEGKNEGKLLVHPGGLLGSITSTFQLDPHDPLAKLNSSEPITNAGMGKTLERTLLHTLEEYESISLTMDEIEDETSERSYYRITKERLDEDKTADAYEEVILYIDKELLLPLRILTYGWEGKLLGEYIYENVKINVGLSDEDFDPQNEAYNFP